MRCDKCGRAFPTYKQIEAYLLVYVHGLPEKTAGERLGITQQAISKRLIGLGRIRPGLIPSDKEKQRLQKKLSLYNTNTSAIIQQF